MYAARPTRAQFKCRVRDHRRRAREFGAPATLTTSQFQRAAAYFNYQCAYCGSAAPITLDVFQPLGKRSSPGLVVRNVLPACHRCNHQKGAQRPVFWLVDTFGRTRAFDILLRIERYFAWAEVQR